MGHGTVWRWPCRAPRLLTSTVPIGGDSPAPPRGTSRAGQPDNSAARPWRRRIRVHSPGHSARSRRRDKIRERRPGVGAPHHRAFRRDRRRRGRCRERLLTTRSQSLGMLASVAVETPVSGWTSSRAMLNKVPEVILFFWIIKCLCTTIGETFSDNLTSTWAGGGNASVHALDVASVKVMFITVGVLAVLLVDSVHAQELRRRGLLGEHRRDQPGRHPDHRPVRG